MIDVLRYRRFSPVLNGQLQKQYLEQKTSRIIAARDCGEKRRVVDARLDTKSLAQMTDVWVRVVKVKNFVARAPRSLSLHCGLAYVPEWTISVRGKLLVGASSIRIDATSVFS